MNEEIDDPFPVEDCLFDETFSNDSVYHLSGHDLKIKQVFGANLGVAAPVWDAAVHLCTYLEKRRVELKEKRVIELGAGTGLLGIFAARLGAVVTLTDLPMILPQLQANVVANTPPGGWPCGSPPSVLALPWGGHQLLDFPSDWDLVLCADVVYLPETFSLLTRTLLHLCHGATVTYFCSKMRTEHQTLEFFEDFLSKWFNVELVQRDEQQNINIYKASLQKEPRSN